MSEKDIRPKIPRRLKKLDPTDLLSVPDENGDYFVVTKQETTKIIRDFIEEAVDNLDDNYILNKLKEIEERTGIETEDFKNKVEDCVIMGLKRIKDQAEKKLEQIEKDIVAYIDYRFDTVVEKMCEQLLSSVIKEQVEERLVEELEKIRIKKSGKGFG